MIDVKKLYFSYTDKPFVENVSFHVGKGEIFGFWALLVPENQPFKKF